MPNCVAFSRPFSRTLIMEGIYDRLVCRVAFVHGPFGGGKRPQIRLVMRSCVVFFGGPVHNGIFRSTPQRPGVAV